ncbi:hypothetical protein K435DRAFT_380110 [Dendrothele bispora CBS 962.96]|uniref:Uncharacterized protein n=1 Tax=Dendrothele bispora (strain CBS 962.96) TaxID=1314807 RepID=A0A4S8MVD8_DENBC|nr:hypothetical protein K435DRAFT_380110 [Dendrothele bispora CBS 962.96]
MRTLFFWRLAGSRCNLIKHPTKLKISGTYPSSRQVLGRTPSRPRRSFLYLESSLVTSVSDASVLPPEIKTSRQPLTPNLLASWFLNQIINSYVVEAVRHFDGRSDTPAEDRILLEQPRKLAHHNAFLTGRHGPDPPDHRGSGYESDRTSSQGAFGNGRKCKRTRGTGTCTGTSWRG